MKKFCIILSLLVTAALILPLYAFAETSEVFESAEAYVLIEAVTGTVLEEKNSEIGRAHV